MNIINIIGISAGLCTTIAFVPQVVKVAKTKKHMVYLCGCI